jgi:hypothetical protein
VGLDTASATFLCAAKSAGVDFTCTAMLGRQTFYPDSASLRRIFSIQGIDDYYRRIDEDALLRGQLE